MSLSAKFRNKLLLVNRLFAISPQLRCTEREVTIIAALVTLCGDHLGDQVF
jgi:hypothetical protein